MKFKSLLVLFFVFALALSACQPTQEVEETEGCGTLKNRMTAFPQLAWKMNSDALSFLQVIPSKLVWVLLCWAIIPCLGSISAMVLPWL